MSPVTPGQIANTVPSASASLCEKIKAVLLELPALLRDFFAWMLASDGSLSDEFKAEATSAIFQPGDLKVSVAATITSGWLEANGATVSRTTYAALFSAIGTTYGAGDGSTTFALPDFRDFFMIGASGTRPLGSTGGEEQHTLTIAEMPNHSHTYTYREHPGDADNGGANGLDATPTGTTSAVGGDQPHNNMPPWKPVKVLIKT